MASLRETLTVFFAVILALALVYPLAQQDAFSSLDVRLHDHLQTAREPHPVIKLIAIDEKSLEELGPQPWSRHKYLALLEKLSGARTIGLDITSYDDGGNLDTAFLKQLNQTRNVILSVQYVNVLKEEGGLVGKQSILSIESLRSVLPMQGYTNVVADGDGIVRNMYFHVKGSYPSYIELLYEHYTNEDLLFPDSMPIRFQGPSGIYEKHSFTDVINGRVPPETFNDALVLVGSAEGSYYTPVSKGVPVSSFGLDAQVLAMLLRKDFLLPADKDFALLLLPTIAILCGILILFLPIYVWLPVMLAMGYAYYRYVVYSFASNIVLPIVYVPLILICVAGLGGIAVIVNEGKSKKKVAETFGRYLSPVIVKELLKQEKLGVSGQRKEVSILFSDIQGFTSLSETLAPEHLVERLNEYLTAMTRIIHNRQGIVDKYIGDAIMAFWGAPIHDKDHAKLVCFAALEMRFKMLELQQKWKKEGLPSFYVRIGVNTGEVIVGNIGSEERFDYTIIGDNVNLASRLEGLNKEFETSVIVSEMTQKELDDTFLTRILGKVRVKGKKVPITVYELICVNPTDAQKKTVERFAKAYALYEQGKFAAAKKEFLEIAQTYGDHVSIRFAEHCAHLQEHHPKHWDGVFEAKEK